MVEFAECDNKTTIVDVSTSFLTHSIYLSFTIRSQSNGKSKSNIVAQEVSATGNGKKCTATKRGDSNQQQTTATATATATNNQQPTAKK